MKTTFFCVSISDCAQVRIKLNCKKSGRLIVGIVSDMEISSSEEELLLVLC